MNCMSIYKKPIANTTLSGETGSFPTKIRNKARMLPFTTSLQYCPGSPSQCNETRKGNKRYANLEI